MNHCGISMSKVRLISFSRVICYLIKRAIIYFTEIVSTKMAQERTRSLNNALPGRLRFFIDRKSKLATWMYFSACYTSRNKYTPFWPYSSYFNASELCYSLRASNWIKDLLSRKINCGEEKLNKIACCTQ